MQRKWVRPPKEAVERVGKCEVLHGYVYSSAQYYEPQLFHIQKATSFSDEFIRDGSYVWPTYRLYVKPMRGVGAYRWTAPIKTESEKLLMRQSKLLYLDTETTGLDPVKHGVWQMAFLFEIDGTVRKTLDLKMAPLPDKEYDPIAQKKFGWTPESLAQLPSPRKQYSKLSKLLCKFVDKYNPQDKAILVGYNVNFDYQMIRQWFEDHGDKWLGSYIWSGTIIDVLPLAAHYLKDRRHKMKNFKLETVAMELGIPVDTNATHDGLYDINLTREVYRIVTGEVEEMDF